MTSPVSQPPAPEGQQHESAPVAPKTGLQGALDRWWPTLLRYSGLALGAWEIAIDGLSNPSVLILAAGMMGLKDVLAQGGGAP